MAETSRDDVIEKVQRLRCVSFLGWVLLSVVAGGCLLVTSLDGLEGPPLGAAGGTMREAGGRHADASVDASERCDATG